MGHLRDGHGAGDQYSMLMVIRVSLGIVEAAVMPAMLIFISNWFTRKERSRANTFLVLGNPVTVLWMSVVSGYLIHAWGWREMFVIEGAPAVLWAFIWWRLARDKPEQVDWLTQQEKNQLAATLANEQKGMKVVRNYRQAFTSPVVIQLCCVHALWSSGFTDSSCGCRRSSNKPRLRILSR